MFDSPFGFFSLLIAIVALIVARKAFNQAAMLRARLDAMDAAAWQAQACHATAHPARAARANARGRIAGRCRRATGNGCC